MVSWEEGRQSTRIFICRGRVSYLKNRLDGYFEEIGRRSKIKRAIVMAGTKIPPDIEIGYNYQEDLKRFIVSPKKIVVVQPEDFS